MPDFVDFCKSITNAVSRGECFACGSRLKNEHGSLNICSSAHMYPWGCPSCGNRFHLSEHYPTSFVERCPQCNSDGIQEAHRG